MVNSAEGLKAFIQELTSSAPLPHRLLELTLSSIGASDGALTHESDLLAGRPVSDEDHHHPLGEFGFYRRGGAAPSKAKLALLELALQSWQRGEQLKRSSFDERLKRWELESVRSIVENVAGTLDPRALGDELMSHLIALLGVRRAQLLLRDGDRFEIATAFGSPVLAAEEIMPATRDGLDEDLRLARPVGPSNHPVGLIAVADKEGRSGVVPFATGDERMLELFTVQAGLALESCRLYGEALDKQKIEQEIEIAATMQSFLYPKTLPEIEGIELWARSAASLQVGGDSYDACEIAEKLLIAVTDVAGKGVGSGMIASGVHAGLRLLSGLVEPLEEAIARLDAYLFDTTPGNRFATLAAALVSRDGQVELVNAGHCSVIHLPREGEHAMYTSLGPPLGLLRGFTFSSHRFQLDSGDTLVLFSDGLSEAAAPDDEELGEEGLVEMLLVHRNAELEVIGNALLDGVDRYTEGADPSDDRTLLLLRRS